MSTISSVIWPCVLLSILWNIIVLGLLLVRKVSLKRMRKFCESALQTTGTVNKLIKEDNAVNDSPAYSASYIFYTANGVPFTGSYDLPDGPTEYKEGLSVTVYYDRNNPSENVCENQFTYEDRLYHILLKIGLCGTLFWLVGLPILVFLSRTIL
ncbi:MAG: DUF3592 domain-containing protein [Lachnospiraceae bacterium]